MPEPIRLKMTGVTPQQATVYEEFARYIPGFLPVTERDAALLMPKVPASFTSDETGVILEKVALELERYLQSMLPLGSSLQTVAIGSLLEAVMSARSSRDHGAHLTLLQKAFEGLVDSLTSFASGNDPEAVVRFRDAHLLVLKALQDPQAYGTEFAFLTVFIYFKNLIFFSLRRAMDESSSYSLLGGVSRGIPIQLGYL